jgi:hypothetical protein
MEMVLVTVVMWASHDQVTSVSHGHLSVLIVTIIICQSIQSSSMRPTGVVTLEVKDQMDLGVTPLIVVLDGSTVM